MPFTPKRCHLRIGALAALLVAGAAVAHEKATGVVAERMKAMEDTAAQAKALDRALKASSVNAADVRARAHGLLAMFPPGSDQGHTYARPEIWAQRDGFERLAQSYDAATEKLVEAARAKAVPELRAQFDTVRRQCLDCHEKFRTPGAERGH